MQPKTCSAYLVLLMLFFLADAAELRGQTYESGLRGAVRDTQGGVIPGATVNLTDEGTNATRTMATNEVGEYMFAKVVPGIYTMRVQVEGFKPYEQSGIEIGVQWFIVLDIRLEIGSVEEVVVVRGESPVIETASASASSTLENEEMVTLPTPSRNVFYLSTTTATVVPLGNAAYTRQMDHNASSNLTIAGGPSRGNNYTLDGVPISDFRNRAIIIPSMEAVAEVKVQASTYDAEMGRTGGGVFNTLHRSGSNAWAGSALVQSRPQWGVGQLYFEKEAGDPKPDSYYWLYGGSLGGPIIRDKTFFWASTEGFRESVTRNRVITFPTEAMARGDFSQSGVIIYDPLTTRPDPNNPGEFIRDPFPGNVIPADRLNPVGLNLASYLLGMGAGPVSRSTNAVNQADQFSLNINHRFSERYTLSGTYMYNTMDEPGAMFMGGGPSDPNNYSGHRRIHMLALNNTFIANDTTVYTFRYGYTQFLDPWGPRVEFDPAELGFSQNYLDQISNLFPSIDLPGYGLGSNTHGVGGLDDARYYSHAVNATGSKFIGNHTLKFGGDYRHLGVKAHFQGDAAGSFWFDPSFSRGPNPNSPDPATGDPLADLLLGFPSEGGIDVNAPKDLFIHYFGFFVQDDWRLSPNLVLNLGVRVEHETGIQERNNRITVGFDRDRLWPIQPIEGMTLRGGLMYAGVDGYPEYQGDPTTVKLGPRAGFSWTLNSETVLRGGYGLFWAPPAAGDMYPSESRMGTRGYSAFTNYFATNDGYLTPVGNMTDPFPNGIEQPQGGSLGLMTGAGTTIDFVDQFSRSPYVQQYSIGIQRELPGAVAISVGYLGSRSDRLSVIELNMNQLEPSFQSLGSALQEQVPNPFFGHPLFGNLSQEPTISRGQLLRPYPQFQDLWAHRASEGRRRYHSAVVKLEKRYRSGWGGRINYTRSRNDDNVEDWNHFSSPGFGFLNAYDTGAEYSRSLSDIPHRLNISGILELPFGKGKRWLDRGGLADAIFGGWSVSAIGHYQSGFPIRIRQQNNNTGLFTALQVPNTVPGIDPGHEGATVDNLDSYLDSEAWIEAEAFTFGNAPRTDIRVRSPFRKNWDLAFQKSSPMGWARLTVRAEILNVFNRPDFRGPETRVGNRNFGRITRVSGFPRTFQFMIRFDW